MERILTIREVYDEKTGEFKNVARCPFCHRPVTITDNDDMAQVFSDKHLVRTAHGCGGYVAVFREVEK